MLTIFLALSETSSSDVEEGPIDNTVGEAAGGEDVSFGNWKLFRKKIILVSTEYSNHSILLHKRYFWVRSKVQNLK